MDRTYLGIDMGTSSVKLTLIDEQKNILDSASRRCDLEYPAPGQVQINPEVWYEALIDAMDEIFGRQSGSKLAGIGVTGQMHTLIVLDENGKPVCPAIMWNDTRTAELVPQLREAAGRMPGGEQIEKIVSTGSPAAGLFWLRKERPEWFARIRKFLIGPDYLVYRLTGKAGTDFCEASTSSLFRMDTAQWSEEMREFLGLAKEVYPPIKGSCTAVGNVDPGIAHRFGFAEDVFVIAGTGDNLASAISTGCMQGGYPVISLGTSGVLMVPVTRAGELKKGKTMLYSPDGKTFSYLVQGVVQSAGESVSWLVHKTLGREDPESLEKEADIERILGSELLFYPHLSGEKTLFADPTIRGALIGLRADMTDVDLYGAVLEGISFAFRELAEKMGLDLSVHNRIKAVGGGSVSDLWLQILADVLGVTIERVGKTVGACVGAACMAAETAVSGSGSAQAPEAADHGKRNPEMEKAAAQTGETGIDRAFDPVPGHRALCDAKYRRYLRIRQAVKLIEEDAPAVNL